MKRPSLPILLAATGALALGCSHLASTNGPISLQVFVPPVLELEVGDTVQLRARALDEAGDSVAAQIIWHVGDTTIAIDSMTGRITALLPNFPGRVQARTGTLVSEVLTFNTFVRADTIVIDSTADTTTVLTGDSVSTPLVAHLKSLVTDSGIPARRLIYTILSPADSSVTLDGGAKADTVGTASDGSPAAPIHLHKNAPIAPDSALVLVSATRPSGTPVPGSGQRFIVHFQP
ncbi:MAG: hypothetical protein ACHQXA_07110 [Gemmatimonadales bacterium]